MYLRLALLLGAFALLDVYYKRWNVHQKLYLYSLLIFSLFIIVGYRECGFDYDNYGYYFRILNSDAWKNNSSVLGVETGYAYLNYICDSYREVLVVMAGLTVGLYSYFIYKYSPLPFFSLFLLLGAFVYPTLMGQYRQALAIGLIVLAASYRDKKIIFFSLLCFAALFHISSLLAILLLFLPSKLYPKRIYIILLIIALLSNLLLGVVFTQYINSFPSFIAQKLGVYSDSEEGLTVGLNIAMLLRVSVFLLFWNKKESILQFKYGGYFLNIYFLSLLIYLGLGFLPQLGGRGSIYFYFFELILAPMLIVKEYKKRTKMLLAFFFLSISLYRQFSFFAQWSGDYIPYKSNLYSLLGL